MTAFDLPYKVEGASQGASRRLNALFPCREEDEASQVS